MNPQISSQYVNIPLTNYSIEKAPADLLSDILAPRLPVDRDTGIYYEYGQEDFDVSGSDVRAPGAASDLHTYSLKNHTYGPLTDHTGAFKIPKEYERNQMAPLDVKRDATRKTLRQRKLFKEADLIAKISDTSVITQNGSPTIYFDDFANSKLKAAFKVAFDTLMKSIQKDRKELSVVLPYPVWSVIVDHPEVIERFKYSQAAIITPEMFTSFLGVKEVLIGSAVKNTSVEGITPLTQDYLWGKGAWVMYRDPQPSLFTVSGLYTLVMPGMNEGGISTPIAGAGGADWTVFSWWDQKEKSTYIDISYYYQQYVMAPNAIYYMPQVIT